MSETMLQWGYLNKNYKKITISEQRLDGVYPSPCCSEVCNYEMISVFEMLGLLLASLEEQACLS